MSAPSFSRPYPFVFSQPVIWGDMDAFGHLNNVQYFRYVESARLAYLLKVRAWDNGLYTVVTQNSLNYLRPVTFPDTLHIGVRIAELRTSGFKMQLELFSETQQAVVATGETVLVMLEQASGKKVPIPAYMRDAVQTLEQGAS